MEKISKEQIKKLRDDKSLEGPKREDTIKALREETLRSIEAALGQKAFEAYTNRPGFNPKYAF
jgi:hypothetical protein